MPDKPLLLIVEDDAAFARTLERSFERRGYDVLVASGPDGMAQFLAHRVPRYAVVDLKLGQYSGLPCVATLHAHDPEMTIIVLTGYASISTAVQAIKLGATSYLAKPANTDDIERAFGMTLGDADAA
ncbi:MAG: DNA-binding response regulator, partial [Sphingomonadales bacterium]|nr:DNA-binding response regulator [Sphingomonadales bacterium]